MLGRTHITIGTVTALLLFRPTTMLEFGSVVAGGALGGTICDIDCKSKYYEMNEGSVKNMVLAVVAIICIFLFDYWMGNGLIAYIQSSFGILMIIGGILFAACCIWGILSHHRTFTHSLLGLTIMSFAAWLVYRPLGHAFCAGMASHIILDLFNEQEIKLLYPSDLLEFSFGVCNADDEVNNVLSKIGSIACAILIPYYGLRSLMNIDLISLIQQGTLPKIELYLLTINVITFIAFCIDYFICEEVDDDWLDENFWHTILAALALFGGAFGMLLSLICLRQELEKCNINMWIISISLSMFWGLVFLIERNPFHLASVLNFGHRHLLPLCVYLIIINIATVILFIRDIDNHHTSLSGMEILLLAMSLIGGALGGFLVVLISESKRTSPAFSNGLPIMIGVQVISVGYLIIRGVI